MYTLVVTRRTDSHKGENGKVCIVGGSPTMHGAPIFSALAAEATGADLIFVCVPRCHAEIARMQSLNFQVHPFAGDDLQKDDVDPLLSLLATMDAAVIGPGLARDARSLAVLQELIVSAPCPMVLDASALQPWTMQAAAGKRCVCTPHLGELERMGIAVADIAHMAQETGVTLLVKGPVDRIAAPDGSIREIAGGNAGLTVGGTGDALAGCVAGLWAQGMSAPDACAAASTAIKRAGDELAKEFGVAYGTRRVIERLRFLQAESEAAAA